MEDTSGISGTSFHVQIITAGEVPPLLLQLRGQGTKKPATNWCYLHSPWPLSPSPLVQQHTTTTTYNNKYTRPNNDHDYNIINNTKTTNLIVDLSPSPSTIDHHQPPATAIRIGPITHETPLGDLFSSASVHILRQSHLAGATSTLFAPKPTPRQNDNTESPQKPIPTEPGRTQNIPIISTDQSSRHFPLPLQSTKTVH